MSTSQRYEGKESPASTTEQTAQNSVKTHISTHERSADSTPENSPETPVPARGVTDPDEVDFDVEEADFDDLDDDEEETDEVLDTQSALEAMCDEWTIPRWQYEDNQNFVELLEELTTGMDVDPDAVVVALQDAFDYGMAFRHPGTAHIDLGITTDGETYQSDVDLMREALSSYQRNRFGSNTDRDLVYSAQIDGILNKLNQEVVRDYAVYGDTETQDGQGVPLPASQPLRSINPQTRHYHPNFMHALQTMSLDRVAPPYTDKRAAEVLFDNLFDQGITSETDEGWTSIIPVTTNALFPQLGIGGYAVGVLLDPAEYGSTSGIVAVEVSSGQVHFGRVGMGNSTSIHLLADLPGFEPVRITRKDIASIRRIVHAFGHPTL